MVGVLDQCLAAGYDHDRNVAGPWVCGHFPFHIAPLEPRQTDVEHDSIRGRHLEVTQRIDPVANGDDGVASMRECQAIESA